MRPDGGSRARQVAAISYQLRAAGSTVVEHDAAQVDPFMDVDVQWAAALEAGTYDLVLSVGGLLPAAVSLAAVCGAPVARIRAPAAESNPASIHHAVASARRRTVAALELLAETSRHVTTGGVDITSHAPTVAGLWHAGELRSLSGTGWSVSALGAPPGEVTVTSAAGDAIVPAEVVSVDAPDGDLRLDLDGRSRRVGSVAVRAVAHGIELLELPSLARR